MWTHPVDKLLEQHCYKSAAALGFYVCTVYCVVCSQKSFSVKSFSVKSYSIFSFFSHLCQVMVPRLTPVGQPHPIPRTHTLFPIHLLHTTINLDRTIISLLIHKCHHLTLCIPTQRYVTRVSNFITMSQLILPEHAHADVYILNTNEVIYRIISRYSQQFFLFISRILRWRKDYRMM